MAFTAADVKTLREMTSVGMMDCKKALTETDGDMDKAVEWLREKGLAKAAKKAGRIAAEGMSYALVENGVGARGGGQLRDRLLRQERRCSSPSSRTSPRSSLDNDPADVDALMNCKYPGTELTVVRDHAREGHVHRREPADPPLRPLCREHQRGLCPCRRQDRRSGEPGRGGRHGRHRDRQERRHADRRSESPLLGQVLRSPRTSWPRRRRSLVALMDNDPEDGLQARCRSRRRSSWAR